MATTPPERAGPAGQRSPLRRRLGLAAGLVVCVFLGWALVRGWEGVRAYDWDIRTAPFAAGTAVLVVFYLASGLGYLLILERLQRPAPPRLAMLSIWARSLLGRYVPGSVVMVVGRVVLSHERGVPRRATAAAMVYELVLSVGVAAAAAVLFVVVYGLGGPAVWVVAALPLGLAVLHPRIFGPVSAFALRKAGREPLPRLIGGRDLLLLGAWFGVIAALLGLGMWLLVVGAAGAGAGGPVFIGSAFLMSYAVSMAAVIVPSGLGVREGAFALALAQNVPEGVAVALAVGARLILTLVEVAFVAVVALAGRRR
ncbi:MAG: lysylphosphatidylglycerol synthase domain-containing protein [Miltoncostaeaceae bacterium]